MSDLDELRRLWAAAQTDDEREQIAALAADAKAETLPLATWALHYARCGIAVFPIYEPVNGRCSCGKTCGSPAKHPRTANGFKDATTDTDQVSAWWTRWPNASIAAATGSDSFTVIDVDTPGGYDSIHAHRIDDETTVAGWHRNDGEGRVVTPSGGAHLYMPAATPLKTAVGILPAVDARGDGGYVVMPPSLGINGRRYAWTTHHPRIGVPA